MNRINYTDEGETSVQPEVNKKRTGLRWKALDPKTLKFVDDGITLTKMCMDSVPPCLEGACPVRDKHNVQTQNLFRRVVARAESRGMVVNKKKMKILCVSDAQTYSAASHFYDANGTKLQTGKSMKILGFHVDSSPSVHAHVRALGTRMREKYWVLRHLKRAGFTEEELARVYCTVVRPVLNYCAVVYHPMLTDEQDQAVERLQAHALKCIYGYENSYAEMREKAGVTTHRARRIALCDKFASKAAVLLQEEAERQRGENLWAKEQGIQGRVSGSGPASQQTSAFVIGM